ncbi:MAG: hypothetical protein ABW131_13110, partial [Candidatus Sedimenticola sp. 6PFRAG5]
NGGKDALQWLAREMVKDPRFLTGSAKFWYKGLFGRNHIAPPVADALNYAEKLKQYNTQEAIFKQIGDRFRDNGYKVRDLLVDLVMSDLFRAKLSDGALSEQRYLELEEWGMGRMLTAQQLQRKVNATVSRKLFYSTGSADGHMYGGSISAGTNQDMTTIMYNLLESKVLGMMCSGNNNLVDALSIGGDANPETAAGEALIKQRIAELHWQLLGERLAVDSEEVERTYRLYESIHATGTSEPISACDNWDKNAENRSHNPERRAWALVIAYLMTDIKYVTE